MKNSRIYKLSKTIAFFGFLFIVLQGILNIQDGYADILKNFYGNKIMTYIGIALAMVGWFLWEFAIAKKRIALGFMMALISAVIAVILANGIFAFLGIALLITGVSMLYANQKDIMTWGIKKKGEA